MKNIYQKQVLILALFAGELMMKSGAEVYRVEDTIERICRACKIDFVECFATATGITLSLDSGADEDDMHTFVTRIRSCDIDLDRISRLNQFSRDFTGTDLSVADGMSQLREIAKLKQFILPLRILGAMLVGAFLCPAFGGRPWEMACAAGASGVSFLISEAMKRLEFADFIRVFISCAGCALFSLLFSLIITDVNIPAVIISGMAIFMPGVAITNSARDLLSGDMLAGISRFTEALITSIAIAGGVGLILKSWMLSGGNYQDIMEVPYHPAFYLMFGFFATFGFGILFNAPKKFLVLIGLIGATGRLVMALLQYTDYNIILACFAGSCIIAILSEMCSRAGMDATTVFILPGIIPFVPGSTLYTTMENMLAGMYEDAIANGTKALITAGSIALALILVATLTRLLLALIRRIEKIFTKKN